MQPMIAGLLRQIDLRLFDAAVPASRFGVTSVIAPEAKGVAAQAARWAEGLPLTPFPLERECYGSRAALARNEKMSRKASAAILAEDGRDRPLVRLPRVARSFGLAVYGRRVAGRPERNQSGSYRRLACEGNLIKQQLSGIEAEIMVSLPHRAARQTARRTH